MRKVFTEEFIKELEVDVKRKKKSADIYESLDKGPSLLTDFRIAMLVFGNPFKFRRFTSSISSAVKLVKHLHNDASVDIRHIFGVDDGVVDSYVSISTKRQGQFNEHGVNPSLCLMKCLLRSSFKY